ncbi:hypothetical protein LIER_17639 [Lithospermum erythrorhizon]|uniref:Transposase n=1 Tax=Lithospermum erythrorhizon TaxID=34254 RepID=A0AAV3QB03_LITER
MGYDSVDDIDYSEESENSESESDDSGEDDELNPKNVLYGNEMDEFDDGDLHASQPTLSAAFLENIEEKFVIPDHDGHGEVDVDAHNDDSDFENLNIVDEEDYVIMSDIQKELDSALHELLPNVEHINCVQHIYKNFKRYHGSQLLRDKGWGCAKASTKGRSNKITLLPPKFVGQAGRPKLRRRRDVIEINLSKGKYIITRWIVHTCKYCGIEAHNIRTCAKKKAKVEGDMRRLI